MTLRVSRDQNGNVTITNSTTGKSEVVSTNVLGRFREDGQRYRRASRHVGQAVLTTAGLA